MALSGSVAVAATTYDNLIFLWEAVPDAAANASRVDWQLELEAGAFGAIIATPGSGWHIVLDGTTYSGTTDIAIGNNQRKTLAQGSVWLTHNADGTRSFRFSFTQEFRITFGEQYISDISGEGTAVLDPIARATTPVLSTGSAELGSVVTVRAQGPEGFLHRLEYRFGSAAGIIGEDISGEVPWTPPLELAHQIPNAPQGTARILCATFLDGQQLGSVQETALVLTVPESAVPEIQELELTDPSGAMDRFGNPVQGISGLTLRTVCQGSLGSTVTAVTAALDGTPYAGSLLTESGDRVLSVMATDSRGRVGTVTRTVTVVPYHKPRLKLSVHRCTSEGTADDTGGWAQLRLEPETAALVGSGWSLTLSYDGETEELDPGAMTLLREADTERCIPIRAVLRDPLAQTAVETVLSPAYATLDLLSGGRGIAFGTTATEPGFRCAMDAVFTGAVSVPVLVAEEVRLPDGTALSHLGNISAVLDQLNGEVV